MYREAVRRIVGRLSETDAFHRAGLVAIDITEEDPFTGDREGHEDEIIGTKEKNTDYAYQWATVQLVGNAVPLVLDARPVSKGESRQEIVEDLLDSAQSLLHVDGVLRVASSTVNTSWNLSPNEDSPTSSPSGCTRVKGHRQSGC